MKKFLCIWLLLLGPTAAAWAGSFDGGGSWAAQVPVASSVAASAVGISQLSATGTPGATTFLRGDNTWAVPAGTGASLTGNNTFTGTQTINNSVTINGAITLSSASVVDAYNASFGAVTAGSTSTLTWTEVTDRLSEFVTSSFTATTAGYYEVSVDAGASQTAGTGCLLIKVNGAEPVGGEQCQTGATALLTVIPIPLTRILNLSASDIVRIDASATTANTTFQKLHLAIRRVP